MDQRQAGEGTDADDETDVASDQGEDSGDFDISRRSVLVSAGAVLSGLVGVERLSNRTGDRGGDTSYGYGGTPVDRNVPASLALLATSQLTESEPNDGTESAMMVRLGESVSGSLSPGDIDYYAFDADAGTELRPELDRADSRGVATMTLSGSEGLLDSRQVGNKKPTKLTETVDQSGRYYLAVADSTNAAGEYQLTFGASDWESPQTAAPTSTPTPTQTSTPTPTPTPTPTSTSTPTPTQTSTPTPTPTPTPTSTSTSTPTQTSTPTLTPEDEYGAQGYGQYGYGG